MTDAIAQLILGVILVAGLSAAGMYLRRRGFTLSRPSRSGTRLELVDRLALAPNASLQLVRMADRLLLVAVSPSGIVVHSDIPAGPAVPATSVQAPRAW